MAASKYKIVENSEYGRHLVATVDLKAGRFVLTENPLVQGPCPTSQKMTEPPSVCPVCYSHFPHLNFTSCKRCKIPLCRNAECSSEDSTHGRNECRIFKGLPQLLRILTSKSDLYEFITVLRCLCTRSQNPKNWEKILKLQSNVPNIGGTTLLLAFEHLTWTLVDTDNETTILGTVNSDQTVQKMAIHCLGVLQTNSISNLTRNKSVENLYFFGSFMAHSCVMNTNRQFDPSSSRLLVTAATLIEAGEPITNCYVPFLENTRERQKLLSKPPWNFICRCPRCKDSSELKTWLGAIRCPKCSENMLCPYPNEGLDQWLCVSCGQKSTDSDIPDILKKIKTIEKVVMESESKESGSSASLIELLSELHFLNPGHSIFMNVKYQLCQTYYGKADAAGMSVEQLKKKSNHANEVLLVLNKLLLPKSNFYLGRVLFHLWIASRELRERKDAVQIDTTANNLISPEETASLAYKNLRFAAVGTDEGKMAEVLEEIYVDSSVLKT